jgi:hypothetical protein
MEKIQITTKIQDEGTSMAKEVPAISIPQEPILVTQDDLQRDLIRWQNILQDAQNTEANAQARIDEINSQLALFDQPIQINPAQKI